jgi:hypothetical protein
MHFATLIPDWNSLDSVRRAHSDLEAAALVFFALLVLFDILAHLSIDDKRKTLLEKIGLYCFAIAILAEVVAYPYGQRNDTLSGQVIGSLDAETREALIKSGTALAQSKEAETNSGDAIDKAGKAQESLGNAENEANRAQSAASNALTVSKEANQIAHGARQEADSFERDIASAKAQAAEAESHLAEALRQADDANKAALESKVALERLRTPRTLDLAQQERVAAKVKEFAGQIFDVALDVGPEPATLLDQIDDALKTAGWKPIGWTGGDVVLSRTGRVPAGMVSMTGVVIQMHPEKIPEFSKAALALRDALLAEGIEARAQGGVGMPNINSNALHIIVGRKPQ